MIAVAVVACVAATPAEAQLTWGATGTGGSGTWVATSSSNWFVSSGSVAWPTTGTSAVFAGTSGTVTISGSVAAQALTFSTTGYLITGGTLSLTGTSVAPITVNTTSGTIASFVTGTAALQKSGTGTLWLTSSNNYSGGTQLSAGVLAFSNTNALGTGTLTFTGNSVLQSGVNGLIARNVLLNTGVTGTFDTTALYSNTFSGLFSGAGSLAKIGTGTLTLSASNTYSGGTQLNAGVLVFGTTTALGTGSVTFGGNAVLRSGTNGTVTNLFSLASGVSGTFDTQSAFTNTLSGSITGSGTFAKIGTGTLTLSAANDYSGGTILNQGVLVFGTTTALGSGSLTFTGNAALRSGTSGTVTNLFNLASGVTGTFDTTSAFTNTLSGPITGSGTFAKIGTGTLTLSASNSYSGGTVLAAGQLGYGDLSALGTGTVFFTGNSILQAGTGGTLANVVSLAASTSGTIDTQAFATTLSNTVIGTGTLTKIGSGTLTLSASNSYSGGTRLVAGLVNFGTTTALGTNSMTFAGNSTLQSGLSGTLTNAFVLSGVSGTFDTQALATTLSGTISSTGTLAKIGTGTLTLTATNTYTGGTVLNQGVIVLGGTGAISSGTAFITGNSTLRSGTNGSYTNGVVLNPGVTGTFDTTALYSNTFSGLFSGAGSLVKIGTGTLTLSASNTYAGGTLLSEGVLAISSTAALGTGTATFGGNTLLRSGANGSIANVFVLNPGITGTFDSQSTSANTLTGSITGSGTLAKIGTGTLTLSAANDYSGGTILNQGVLVFGTTTALGSGTTFFTGNSALRSGTNGTVANGIVLNPGISGTFDSQSAFTNTLSGPITGSGTFAKIGTGTLTLSTSNSYSGGTILAAGQLGYGDLSALGTGTVFFTAGSILQAGTGGTLANVVSLAASTSGTIDTQAFATTLSNTVIGTGTLTKIGSGTLTLSASNTYSGGTRLVAGLVNFGTTTALGTNSVTFAGNSTLQSGLSGTLTNAFVLSGASGTFDTQAFANTLSGAISSTGTLAKIGTGTLTLTANNSYSGGTVLNQGVIVFGTTTALGTGTAFFTGNSTLRSGTNGTLTNGVVLSPGVTGTFDTQALYSNTFSGVFSGAGSLVKIGTGTLTLSGSNTYAGGTLLSEGVLAISSTAALGTGTATFGGNTLLRSGANGSIANLFVLNPGITGTFDTQSAFTNTLTGSLTGSGTFAKIGTGTLTLSAANDYSGGTLLNQGVLVFGTTTALGSGSLTYTGNSVLRAGANGGGTLATVLSVNPGVTGTFDAQGNAVTISNPIAGSGNFIAAGTTGTVTLGAVNTITGTIGVVSGVLQPSADNVFGTATVAMAGGELRIGSLNPSVSGFVTTGGTLTGAGTLTAPSYRLGGGVIQSNLGSGTLFTTANTTLTGQYSGTSVVLVGGNLTLGSGTRFSNPAVTVTGSGGTLIIGGTQSIGALNGTGNVNTNGQSLIVGVGSTTGTWTGFPLGSGTIIKEGGGQQFFQTGGYQRVSWEPFNGISFVANSGTLTLGTGQFANTLSVASGAVVELAGSQLMGLTISGSGTVAQTASITNNNDANTVWALSPGAVVDVRAGSLLASANGRDQWTLNQSRLNVADGAAFNGDVGNIRVDALTGSGTIQSGGDINAYANLANVEQWNYAFAVRYPPSFTFGVANGSGTFSGMLAAPSGVNRTTVWQKAGTGTQTLTGTMVYPGINVMQVSAGVLQIGDGGTTGWLAGGTNSLITGSSAAWLVFNRSDGVTQGTDFGSTISGDLNVRQAGSGTLVLNGVNTHTGTTQISSGALSIVGSLALQNSSLDVVAGTATLGQDSTIGSLSGAGGAVDMGSWTLTAGGNNRSGTFAGSLVNGSLTKAGSGTLTLTGSSGYVGATTLAAGGLEIASGGSLDPSSPLSLSWGTLALSRSGQQAFASTALSSGEATVSVVAGGTVNLGAITRTTGVLNIAGAGSAVTSSSNTGGILGGWAIYGGTTWAVANGSSPITPYTTFVASLTAGTAAGSYAGAFIDMNSTVVLDGPATPAALRFQQAFPGSLTLTGSNQLTTGGILVTANVGDNLVAVTGGTLTSGANEFVVSMNNLGNVLEIGSVLADGAGSTRFVKAGSGTVSLTAANSYSGGTLLDGGVVQYAAPAAFGSGSLSFLGNAAVLPGASGTLSNAVYIGSGVTGTVMTDPYSVTLSGLVSGPGALAKTGAGTLTLSGSNTYSGGTRLAGGVLAFGDMGALGSGSVSLLGSAVLQAGVSGTLTNVVSLASGVTGTFDTQANSVTLANSVAGAGTLKKVGAGTLVLSPSNSYSGGTVLDAGVLVFGGTPATGAVSVNHGGVSTIVNPQGGGLGAGGLSITGNSALKSAEMTGVVNTIGVPITISPNVTGTIDTGTNAVWISGPIGNPDAAALISGAGALAKIGAGTLTIYGTHSWSGGLFINEGTVVVPYSDAFRAGLNFGTGTIGFTGNAGIQWPNWWYGSLANPIWTAPGATGTLTGANYAIALTGSITGSGTLAFQGGPGTIPYGGTADVFHLYGNNTSTGGAIVGVAGSNSTNLRIYSSSPFGTGTLTLDTSVNLWSFNSYTLGPVTVVAGRSPQIDTGSFTVTVNGALEGAGTLGKIGTGTLALTTSSGFTGRVNSGAGVITLGDIGALGNGSLAYTGNSVVRTGTGGTFSNAIVVNTSVTGTFDTNGFNVSMPGGQISGAGVFVKAGSGTLTLSAGNSHSGGTRIEAGTVELGAASSLGTGGLTFAGNSTLRPSFFGTVTNGMVLNPGVSGTIDTQGYVNAFSGGISGSGGLVKAGPGWLTLSGSNTYSGGTILNEGVLAFGTTTALGTGAVTFTGNATLRSATNGSLTNAVAFNPGVTGTFDTQDVYSNTFSGVFSGSGSFAKLGTGTLTLAGANTYSGGAVINQGVVAFANTSAFGTGAVTVAYDSAVRSATNGTLANAFVLAAGATGTFDSQSAFANTLSGIVSGDGAFVKLGTGTLTLSGSNSYTGGTQLAAGVLAYGTTSGLGLGGVTFTGNSVLRAGLTGTVANAVTLGSGVSGTFDTQGFVATLSGAIDGSGTLAKIGSGTLVLSQANSYSGGTLLNAGVLRFNDPGALGTGPVTFTGNSVLQSGVSGTLDDGVVLNTGVTGTFDTQGFATTLSQVISGSGSLAKMGSGTLTLTAANTYSGSTAIFGGVLEIAAGGSLPSTGTLSLSGGGLTLSRTGLQAFAATTLTVGAANLSVVSGGTLNLGTITRTAGGVLNVSGDGSVVSALTNTNGIIGGWAVFGGTTWAVANGSNPVTGLSTYTLSSTAANTPANYTNQNIDVDSSPTLSGTVAFNSLRFNTVGSNTLALTGSNQLVTGGVLVTANIGANPVAITGGTITSTANAFTVTQNNPSAALTIGSVLANNGATAATFTLAGTGTVVLSNSNSYTGGSTLVGGVLAYGTTASLGTGTVAFGGNSVLQARAGGTLSNAFSVAAGVTGTFDTQANAAGISGTISGAGNFAKAGSGTLTLTAANTLSGTVNIAAGGLALNNPLALQAATIDMRAGDTGSLVLLQSTTIAGLMGTRGIDLGTRTLGVGNNNTSTTYAGSLSNGGLSKVGSGTLTLTGSSSYAGGTQLAGGQITYGDLAALGTGTVSYTAGAALQAGVAGTLANVVSLAASTSGTIDTQSLATTLSGSVIGSGTLAKIGTGTLTLSASNAYTGGTRLVAGLLNFGTTTALGTNAVTFVGNSTLQSGLSGTLANSMVLAAGVSGTLDTQAFATGLTGIVSGSGTLVKVGTGSLSLSANNSYSGGTVLTAGLINFGTTTALGTGTAFITGNSTLQSGVNGTVANGVMLDPGVTGTFDTQAIYATTLAGVVRGDGGIAKMGTGTLTLSATNTYAGGTLLNEGVLVFGTTTALGTGTVTFGGNAVLRSGTSGTVANVVVLNPGITGTFDSQSAFANTLAGSVTGAGGLAKVGTGTLTLSAGNDYSGGTVLNQGVLVFASPTALGTGSLSFTGNAVLRSGTNGTVANGIVLNAGVSGTFDSQSAFTNTLSGPITGSGTFVKIGTGTLTLSASNGYTGGTVLSAGQLGYGDLSALGTGTVFFAAGSTLQAGVGGTLANGLSMGSSGTFDTQAFGVTLAGPVSGAGGLTKAGAGTLTVTGSNSWTGGLAVSAGIVEYGDVNALGTGTVSVTGNSGLRAGAAGTVANAVSLASGVTGTFDTAGFATTLSGTISGAGGLTKAGVGTLTLSASNTYGGPTTVTAGALALGASNVLSGSTAVTVAGGELAMGGFNDTVGSFAITSGSVTGAGKLTAPTYALGGGTVAANLGSGTLTVTSNAALVGTSDATVVNLNAGSLMLTGSGRFTAAPAVSGSSGASVTLGGDETFGSLAGGANVGIGSNDLTVGSLNTSTSFSGVVAGAGSLRKIGTGTLAISSSQAFSGQTSINAGTLVLAPGGSLASSSVVNLAVGAFLDATEVGGLAVSSSQTLAGNGTVSGGLTIANGATLSPGSSPGTLSVDSGLITFGGGGNYNWQIYAASGTPGFGGDYLDGSAGATMAITATAGNKFNINLWSLSGLPNTTGDVADFDPNTNYQWLIAQVHGEITGFNAASFSLNLTPYNGTGGFTNGYAGTFSVARGDTVGGSSNQLFILYTAAVPEPGALALAACGLAVAGWHGLRRRRRK